MKIRAYILLPESEDDFVRIGDNANSYEELIGEIVAIKQQLRLYDDFELCYNSENINTFLTKAEQLINGNYLANCRTQLKRIFWNNARNVSTNFLKKVDCVYVNWKIDYTIADTNLLIADASEAKLNEDQDKTIIINIANAYSNNRDCVHIIKDAIHYNELPILITIPVANNEIEFSEWISNLSSEGFSLRDKLRFEKTTFRWKKQCIYREKSNGNYWYYDYFHKDNVEHYEVFDNTGTTHLGEADKNGNIKEGTKSTEKKISHII